MPGATEFPEKPQEVEDLIAAEHKERADFQALTWAYYHGEHKKPLKVRVGAPDDNVILNVCKKLVNSGVALLFGQDVLWELVEGEQTAEEGALEQIWLRNRRKILLHEIALNGFVTGHAALKIVPDVGGGLPRLVNIDPSRLTVVWRADDLEAVLGYVLTWSDDARQDMMRDGDTWLVRDLKRNRSQQWDIVSEVRWGYPWPPVMDWKNLPNPNRYYGLSDLGHADQNDAINFVATNTNRILRFHAHPKTIGLGMQAKDVQETAVDGFWTIPNAEAKISNLEMQSDLQSSMTFLDLLRGAFFSEGAGVDFSTIKDKLGDLTNFGLRVLFKDALDRLAVKRELYGAALIEVNKRLLDLAGMGYEHDVTLTWPDPLPSNPLEITTALAQESALGVVSKQTIAADLGRDWDTEQERMASEASSEGDVGTAILRAFERGGAL